MRIALINGSPKPKDSASGTLLEDMKYFINGEAETADVALHTQEVSESARRELEKSNVWVFALPLYVDAVPGHLLSCLTQIERLRPLYPRVRVYAIVNCGFYEGIQTEPAMEVLKNWCARAGLVWSGGAGIGGGGSISPTPRKKHGSGPWAPIDKALDLLATAITEDETQENTYVSVAFPRFLYKLAAHLGWRMSLRANGLKRKDIGNTPELR